MEKLNGDIAEEEAKREEQRVRFVAGIKAQVAEKGKLEEEGRAALMSRDDFMRQTNEMAQRLKNWDWDTAPEIGVSTHFHIQICLSSATYNTHFLGLVCHTRRLPALYRAAQHLESYIRLQSIRQFPRLVGCYCN